MRGCVSDETRAARKRAAGAAGAEARKGGARTIACSSRRKEPRAELATARRAVELPVHIFQNRRKSWSSSPLARAAPRRAAGEEKSARRALPAASNSAPLRSRAPTRASIHGRHRSPNVPRAEPPPPAPPPELTARRGTEDEGRRTSNVAKCASRRGVRSNEQMPDSHQGFGLRRSVIGFDSFGWAPSAAWRQRGAGDGR